MTEYLLFSQVQAAMGTPNVETGFKSRVRDLIAGFSRLLEQEGNRRYDHRVATISHNARSISRGGDVDGTSLLLNSDLISATSVLNGDGSTVASSDYVLLPEEGPAADIIELVNLNLTWTYSGGVNPLLAIKVDGIWGWGGQWLNTGITLAGNVDENATNWPVSAIAGLEGRMMLRVDSEYALLETDPSASPITVRRAQNGSAAATHDSGAVIYRFEPDWAVQRVVKRMVLWASELEDNPIFGVVQVGDFQQAVDITQMPKDIQGAIWQLRRKPRIRAVEEF